MTREEAGCLAIIAKAYAEGKEIEFRGSIESEWEPIEDPSFGYPIDSYRIKKEPKHRPFKDVKECFEEMKKHEPFGWICNVNDGYNLIVFLNDEEIHFDGSCVSYPEAFKLGYTFFDGSPFGIKEE